MDPVLFILGVYLLINGHPVIGVILLLYSYERRTA